MTKLYDRYVLFAALGLLAMGLLMVTSASMVISEKIFSHPFHYFFKQLAYIGLSVGIAFAIYRIPTETWQKISPYLLVGCFVLLIVVLVPGIGHTVNGSRRWIKLGFMGLQVSELVKLFMFIFMASYLERRQQEVQTTFIGFAKPLIIWVLLASLLLLEPDFGAAVVLLATILGVLFLAGARLSQFFALICVAGCGLALLVFSSQYRLERLTAFLDPWANQYGSGYQLTQSLIAFGRGGWFGVGLGDSVQKLFYLPEAHTDFIFAVLAEELGLFGELVVLGLYGLLVTRTLLIGRTAYRLGHTFGSYLAYAIGIWLGIQAMINIGVASGVLPTKGLTLPLMSYGGSSLLIACMSIAIVLRIDYENRYYQLKQPKRRRRAHVS